MRLKLVFVLVGVVGSSFLHAQSLDARLESCNKIKNSKQRLDCLKAEMAPKPAPQKTVVIEAPKPLLVSDAAAICEPLFNYENPHFRSDHAEPSEEVARSTDSVMAVAWPSTTGQPPSSCFVDRVSRKPLSMVFSGRSLSQKNFEQRVLSVRLYKDLESGDSADFVKISQGFLTKEFKDPVSATYRNMYISRRDDGSYILCGEVNAKNSYGAYVGFNRFYATEFSNLNDFEKGRDSKYPRASALE